MIFLIRYKNSNSGKAYDVKMAAPEITLGAGQNQHICLPGKAIAEAHAAISLRNGQPEIQASRGNRVSVNDKLVRRAALQFSDEIKIGEHGIRLVAAPEGFDIACTVSINEEQRKIRLGDSWQKEIVVQSWTPRRIAYGLSLLLLVVLVWLPYSAYVKGTGGIGSYVWTGIISAMQDAESQSWRGDSLWSPGPLLPAHRNAIGNDCSTCHTKAFEPVADTACATCHNQSKQHFDNRFSAGAAIHSSLVPSATIAPGALAEALAIAADALPSALPRCESCHKEHNEPQTLIANTDTLCTQCHAQAFATAEGSVVNIATAFNASSHPEFRYSMLMSEDDLSGSTPDPEMMSVWRKVTQPANVQVDENSHLEFSHELHLQLDEPALACSNCHQLDVDNEHFAPIAMQQHCAECHTLEFNGREIPHGDPALAIQTIEEYFIALYVTPGREPEEPARRLPGRLERRCEGTDYECAIERADREIQLQFNNSGCVTCHRVAAMPATAARSVRSPLGRSWFVEPVRINSDWYANARFNHASHLTQSGQSEIELCSGCHQAETSAVASEILIPRSQTCFECHSDSTGNNKIQMGCVDCHRHHPPQAVFSGSNERSQ